MQKPELFMILEAYLKKKSLHLYTKKRVNTSVKRLKEQGKFFVDGINIPTVEGTFVFIKYALRLLLRSSALLACFSLQVRYKTLWYNSVEFVSTATFYSTRMG